MVGSANRGGFWGSFLYLVTVEIRLGASCFMATTYAGLRLKSLFQRITPLVGLVAAVVVIAGAGIYKFLFPPLPKSVQVFDIMWTEQGWTSDQRQKYYQTTQGCLIVPYSWFFGLDQAPKVHIGPMVIDFKIPFNSQENITRYRLIPDVRPKYNPDLLPIGITKIDLPDQYVGPLGMGQKEWLSYSCAACHTAQMNYHGIGIRVDGAPGMWNFTAFNTALANGLFLNYLVPSRFDRFAQRVLLREGRPDTPQEREELRNSLGDFLATPVITDAYGAALQGKYPTAEGFGRIDALGRGANGQFSQLDSRNVLVADGPVSVPPLWYTHDYDWVQTVAAIRQPMGRNVTESWGVHSIVDLVTPDETKLFASSVTMDDMFWMETLISVMTPPKWPEDVFGQVDRTAAERGRKLYEEEVYQDALDPAQEQWCAGTGNGPPCPNPNQPRKGLCARCHAPVHDAQGKYWQLPMYKLEFIGTDPFDAENFANRKVYTGPLKAFFGGADQVGIGQALQATTSAVMAKKYKELNVPPSEQPAWNGFRPNDFRAPTAYPARPLDGYWATSPFLHNNSVPTLYQLLSPVAERDTSFWTGDLDFDPVNVGYSTKKFTGGFEFRTRKTLLRATVDGLIGIFRGNANFARDIPGNSNAGHEFRNAPKGTKGVIGRLLTPQERRDIIEYMKIMQTVPPVPKEEMDRRQGILHSLSAKYEGNVPPAK